MNYKEFGKGNSKAIILLHGGGMSWWNYREEAEMLEKEYHIIVPFLDGHAGSDRHFTTIESNAEEIVSFINEQFSGTVFMIGGLSLGGQILLEILSQKGDICRHALIESAMVIPSKLTNALLGPSLWCSYPLIKRKWFAKMQFRQLRIKEELFDDYYRDTCAVSRKDMTAFLKANTSYYIKDTLKNSTADVHIFYGEKEIGGIKRSARMISDTLPSSTLTELKDMYHADLSINHPEEYIKAIREITDVS